MSVKRQSFLVLDMPFTVYPPLSLADIRGYCVEQYHVPTKIEKCGYFSLGITQFFEPAASRYILIMEYYPNTKSRENLNINS